MDFTIKVYKDLLESMIRQDYTFQTFKDFLTNPEKKSIILRHDVDLLPENSLNFAEIQKEYGIKGTYYFRAVPESWDENIIERIASLGHEIGYHYENLTSQKGSLEKGIEEFENNLNALRKIAPVSTICMHGSPMSKYDSKDLWKKYDYKQFGLVGEPYFDVDFDRVLYLTDTGRRWDGAKVSVRDKVSTSYKNMYHSTEEICTALANNELSDQIMFTFHPQRWHDNLLRWSSELCTQNLKNIVKKYFFVKS